MTDPKLGQNTGNRGKGRPKGSKNKTTTLLKDALLIAARKAGGGGEDGLVNYLEMQATKNPGPFMSLLGKVLPLQVTGENGKPIKLDVNPAQKLKDHLDALASRASSETPEA